MAEIVYCGAVEERRVSHYRLVERIGRGAMGEVWRAVDVRLGREVALKLLPSGGAADRQARLLREAQAASALNHPGIVTIYDVGIHEGHPFLVMEIVTGESFGALAKVGEVSAADAARLCALAADALGAAHERGVLHRDVKSENIMRTAGGAVKVLDFGLAKLAEAGGVGGDVQIEEVHDSATQDTAIADTIAPRLHTVSSGDLTHAGELIGTPAYMSPEQALSATIDARGEIFSLGVVLFELLVGVRPFDRPTVPETLEAIREAAPPKPSIAAPSRKIPPALDAVVLRALAKDPGSRFPDMAAFAAALRAAVRPRRRLALWLAPLVPVGLAAVWWTNHDRGPARAPRPTVSKIRRITFEAGCQEYPSLTPDGNKVVYDGDSADDYDLWLLDLTTSKRRRLTTSPGWDVGPSVSPDGKRVAYIHFGQDVRQLRVLPVDGDDRTARSLGPAIGFPAWTPDGKIVTGGRGHDLVRWDPDGAEGAEPVSIAHLADIDARYLTARADGTLFGILRDTNDNDRMQLVSVARGRVARIDADVGSFENGIALVGNSVYYGRRAMSEDTELVRRDLADGYIDQVPGGVTPYAGFTIAPSGKRLIYSKCQVHTDIVRLRPGSAPAPILDQSGGWHDDNPWPLGRGQILFTSDRDGVNALYTADLSTGESTELIPGPASEAAVGPGWIAYRDATGIAIRDASGAISRLTDNPNDHELDVTPAGEIVFTRPDGLWIVKPGGDPPRQIAGGVIDSMACSPTGDLIAFLGQSPGGGEVPMATDSTGRTPTPLVPNLPAGEYGFLAFAPDGKHILTVRARNDLLELALDGSPPVVRWHDPKGGLDQPIYAPDGDGFIAGRVTWSGDLWLAEGSFTGR
jgi:serine/threonine protein kinase